MSAASEIRTVWTVWPLMSIPRMLRACVSASCGVAANLTPPALPRPPALTCAFTMTGPPSCSAAARAASGVDTTTCLVTGTPYFPNSSFACHSNRSTRREVTDGERRGGSGGCPAKEFTMPRVPVIGVVAGLVLSLSSVLGLTPSTAAQRPYSVQTLTFTVTVPNESVTGGAPQQCTIVGDLYTPRAASATHRMPAILTTNGFGG